MSELCPNECAGKRELAKLLSAASLGTIVKELTGCTLAGTSNKIGHPIDGSSSVVTVFTANGTRNLGPGQLTSIRLTSDLAKDEADSQQKAVNACEGEVELEIKTGGRAGRVLRMCGVVAEDHLVMLGSETT